MNSLYSQDQLAAILGGQSQNPYRQFQGYQVKGVDGTFAPNSWQVSAAGGSGSPNVTAKTGINWGNVAGSAISAANDVGQQYIGDMAKAKLIRANQPVPQEVEAYRPILAEFELTPQMQMQRRPLYG